MLPDILKVAEEYGVAIDHKSRGKKETMAQCPFCNSGKFHLSLNADQKIFKCWFCNKSGGVLHFEALLADKPYGDIRAKYFGSKRSKNSKHPAYQLSPEQLKKIGWHDKKRDAYNVFAKNKDEVALDWKKYEYEEYVKYYALFTLIRYYPFKELQKIQYSWFRKEIKNSKVEQIEENIVQAYKDNLRLNWTEKGEEIARIAYKTCLVTEDEEFVNLYANVLFAIELLKLKNQKNFETVK